MTGSSITKSIRNMIVAVMVVSAFVTILNQTLLNTALPQIMKGLDITENTSQMSYFNVKHWQQVLILRLLL